jgi:phosphatidylinositol 3-kinase
MDAKKSMLLSSAQKVEDDELFLVLQFPKFNHRMVYDLKATGPALPALAPLEERDRIFILHDPQGTGDVKTGTNPVELKYQAMTRGGEGTQGFHRMRPSIQQRRQIQEIINDPFCEITPEIKTLFWRFVHSIKRDKNALTKFLRCVNWDDTTEARKALQLMREWADIEVSSALEMLSPSFSHPEVRRFTVQQLERADDEELQSYLLQLVQGLRYERDPNEHPLADFLFRRCSNDMTLCNYFFWYVKVETEDANLGAHYNSLLHRFRGVLEREHPDFLQSSDDQDWMRLELIDLVRQVTATKANRVGRMRSMVDANGAMSYLREFKRPIRVACDPSKVVVGVRGESSTLFKSAMAPLLCALETTEGKTYKVIFKSGDDLRQDQLIMQMFNLMDSLLKKVGLDLKLTPYVILATSQNTGYLEFVSGSKTINEWDGSNRDIREYLQHHNPKVRDLQESIQTFIKSCAGYCVITYLLGIGDRHLDNVMILPRGQLFHIDFGYIFGMEPRGKLTTPIRFTEEMVTAMGGANSDGYRQFCKFACVAYNILRKHATLIINLLALTVDAGLDVFTKNDPKQVLTNVQRRFRLELTDEQAEEHFLDLIEYSYQNLGVKLTELVHRVAVALKN